MKIKTISKLLEVLNKTLPTKKYIEQSIQDIERIDDQNKGKKV
jgi:hypothetical protein